MVGNLKLNLLKGVQSFQGIHGYEDTVIPDLERAIISGHNINLLGLRGQAKTKIGFEREHLAYDFPLFN